MTRYLFDPTPVRALPIRGSDALFPVRRIYCVGRNYAEHAVEMGHDPVREAPFFFQKAVDSLIPEGGPFPYPPASENVHYELELVVALHAGGRDIPQDEALDRVFGYAVGLDMTRRDLQLAAKKAGRPWEVGKAFDHAAPCSMIAPATAIGHPRRGAIQLTVNDAPKQTGDIDQMIWNVPEIVAHLSGLFELKAGDLIFTGTPAGVGPVKPGDRLHGTIGGVGELRVAVV